MAYLPTVWENGVTEITAERLNKLEQGVASAQSDSSSILNTVGRWYSPVTYAWPDWYKGTSSKWAKFLAFGPQLGIVILNRNSGTWDVRDEDFVEQARRAKLAGAKKCVFYLKTLYGAGLDPARYAGGLGVSVEEAGRYSLEAILSRVRLLSAYSDVCDGVFLDEMVNGWGDQADRVEFYVELFDAIKSEFGSDFLVVGNPGANTVERLLSAADVLMTFEGTAEQYLTSEFVHPEHYRKFSGARFWHVVHDVANHQVERVFQRAESFGVNHLFVTERSLRIGSGNVFAPEEHPYDQPPKAELVEWQQGWCAGILGVVSRMWVLAGGF